MLERNTVHKFGLIHQEARLKLKDKDLHLDRQKKGFMLEYEI